MSASQRVVLRLGALACLLGVVVLAVVTVRTGSGGDAAAGPVPVPDATSFVLPDPGLLGSEVVVYGRSDRPGVRPADLGCRLFDEAGGEQSRAKMSQLEVRGAPAVVVDGAELQPLFTVGSYPAGARVECSAAAEVSPLAVSATSTFGSSTLVVRGVAGCGALLLLVVGVGGLVLTRRSPG